MSSPLRVLHLPETSLPWMTGGKEVFVQNFAFALQNLGVDNFIALHQSKELSAELGIHHHQGIPIHVLPPLPDYGSRYTLFARRFPNLPGFRSLLDSLKPDVVHFHDQGGGASLSHLELVHEMGIKTVVTYHTPGQTCPQGELLRNGHIPCDGKVLASRCTTCRFKANHAPDLLAKLLGQFQFPGLSPHHPNRVLRLLTAKTTTEWFKEALDSTIKTVDAVVVLAEWGRGIWLQNDCPPHKLHLLRTGGDQASIQHPPRAWDGKEPLRVVCTGRFVSSKGFHVLVEAVQKLPKDFPIQVQFLGPYADSAYGRSIQNAIADDPRFLKPKFVKHEELLDQLATYHLAVIPSVGFETGPLSAFDALAAGLPILGSRLGGIAEIVQDGTNGRLFPASHPEALAQIFTELHEQPELLAVLQAQLPKRLRTLEDHVKEMLQLYAELIPNKASSSAVPKL